MYEGFQEPVPIQMKHKTGFVFFSKHRWAATWFHVEPLRGVGAELYWQDMWGRPGNPLTTDERPAVRKLSYLIELAITRAIYASDQEDPETAEQQEQEQKGLDYN